MSYKTVIVDDEKNCVEVLEILLKKDYPELEVVKTLTSSKEALQYLRTNAIDLLFLDIQMPYFTGIEMLNELEEHNFRVIFTTAFDQYALEAIKLSALDYLLKPIDDDELKAAVEKFKKIKGPDDLQHQLKDFLAKMGSDKDEADHSNEKIAVSFHDKISFYSPSEICYCHSHDNYTEIHLQDNKKVTASKTIRHFEDMLGPSGFIRTHQSYLVNKELIKEFNKKDGGYIVMQDGTKIPVSRNRKEELLQFFKKI